MLPHDGSKILLRNGSFGGLVAFGAGVYSLPPPFRWRTQEDLLRLEIMVQWVLANALIPVKMHLVKMHPLV